MNSLAPSQDSKSLGLLPPHPSLVEPFLFTKLRGPRPSRVPRVRPPSGRQQSRMEGCVGEESFQLWELNRRLEAYLSRVKALEEQNELLSGELRGLRAQSGDASWRARADDELAALRALVDERWREKHAAEVERDNLAEELEGVAGRCQQLLLARERTAEEAACSRRAVEAEQCAQGWLSTQAADLERELEAMRAAHEEERAYLHAQVSCAPREPPALPRGPPGRVPEVEELARRLGDEWRGAVRGYQERVAHMESSLGQARERLGRAVQGARESRRELQQLQAERSGLQERRAALQRRLEGCWQDRLRATEKFQLAVEALEQEKQGLQSQIAQVLEGRQQLAHLKMSLSLEVATYRTLLEAENSRLQTPGFGSQASLDFQEPKLQLHFLGTPEGHRLGPVLPVLSPTPLPSLLPYTLETPEPVFLKTQEFLQAHTPTLASTPIPPTPQALCPATNAEVRAQDAPLSLLQTQGGKPQTPEPRWDEAKVAVPASNLLGLEEPGGKQLVASTGHFPEDQAALAPSVNFDQPTLEAKDGEPNGSRVSIIFQEDEGQILELVEKEAAIEVKVESSLGQETREEGGLEEIQDFQDPLGKETLKAVGEEPLISLKIQGHEAPGKENLKSLRSIEENSETLKSLEKVKQTLLKPLEEKDMEAEGILEKEVPELPNLGKEDLRIVDQELVTSPEGTLETVSFLGKENQRVEGYPDENIESFKKSQHLLGYQEAVNHETLRSPTNEDQEPLRSVEEEEQVIVKPLERENQEPLKSLEEEEQVIVKPLERENQEPLKSLEEEEQVIVRPPEKENRELLGSAEEDERIVEPLEVVNKESLGYLKEEEQVIVKPLEKENQEPLRSLEEEEQVIVKPLERENQEPLKSLEEEEQVIVKPLERENQEPLKSLEEEEQVIVKPLERENQEPLKSLEEEEQVIGRLIEKENPEPWRSLEEEEEVIVKPLEKENQEPLRSLEDNNQEPFRPLEKEIQESLRSLEEEEQVTEMLKKEDQYSLKSLGDEDQVIFRPLEKENQESLRSLGEQGQEIQRFLEQAAPQTLSAVEKEDQMAVRSPEKVNPGLLQSLGNNQEIVSFLEKENQELLTPLKESIETVQSLETEDLEPLKIIGEKDLEILNSLEAQKSLWSVGEMNRETMKPLENEIQKPLEYVEENEETPHPLEKENQDLRSLHKWDLETVQSPEWAEKESQQHLEVEECLEVGENLELLRSLEEGQELLMSAHQLRWKDMVEDQALGQDLPLGRTGMDSEDQEKLYLSGQGGKEEVKEQGGLQLDATGEAWRPGSPEPKERRIPAEEASRKEDQLEQMGTPGLPTAQGKPKVTELVLEDEDIARGGDHASLEVTLGSEATRGWSAAEAGLGLTQEVVGLGDPGHLAREEAIQPPLREECLEVERVQDLEGPGKDRKEAEFLEWPKTSRDPLEPPKHCEVPEPVASWGEEEALAAEISGHEGSDSSPSRPPETEENEVAEPELGLPDSRPTESHLPTLVLEDALGLQPQGEGSREAGWGQAEALEGVEAEQQFGPGEDSEALQDWEESKEDSEADELGETLPDSTPLGFYLSSPTSPPWDLAGQQRLSPQGEATKKGWDPAVLGPQGLGVPFSDEDVEEEQGHDSDLSEEFEDLGTETSLLPGVPREVAEPLGQVPPLLESACWDQGGESDGFADEEESGEEGEDEEHKAGMELGVQWWGPGPTVGGLQAQDRFQRGNIQEHEAVGVSGPWDDSLSGAEADVSVTALEIKSQDAAEPSGSEESDSVSLEMEDQMSGREVKGIGTWVGSTSGINGQGPNLEESEHVNGRVINGLELSEGQGTHGDQDEGLPLQEEEGSTLKTPWVGSPVHLVPSQFPKYPPREADRDSWSSGED
ncbi:nestin isoform X10 [Nannospalax galili]|uniref:nestin isoform X10 n=1 Tax=Nannospalax galili TaxID=1026970 RepID=UPI00111C5D8F|nr:nestin isoform X10 [Nannospalax galili]